jgi:hypothetical protein
VTKATLRDSPSAWLAWRHRAGDHALDAMKAGGYHSASGDRIARHYPKLIDMARDVDIIVVITPGGAGPRTSSMPRC